MTPMRCYFQKGQQKTELMVVSVYSDFRSTTRVVGINDEGRFGLYDAKFVRIASFVDDEEKVGKKQAPPKDPPAAPPQGSDVPPQAAAGVSTGLGAGSARDKAPPTNSPEPPPIGKPNVTIEK